MFKKLSPLEDDIVRLETEFKKKKKTFNLVVLN